MKKNLDTKITLFSATLLLSGCALFNPYIDSPTIELTDGKTNLPELRKAIEIIETKRKEAVCKRRETTAFHTSLNLLAFGAVAGSGVSALYGASRDLVLALGLGAAGAYTGNTLFFNDIKSTLYSKADEALGCVSNNAYAALGQGEILNNLAVIPIKKTPPDCIFDENTQLAIDEYDLQLTNIKRFNSQDMAAKQQALSACRLIISQLHEELKKNEPSADAIMNAANSISPLGMSYLNNPTKSQTLSVTDSSKQITAIASKKKPILCENTESYRADLANTAKLIKENLAKAQQAIDAIGLCKLESLPVADPLGTDLEKDTTELKKGDIQTIHIKGGEGFINLMPQWIGNVPPSDQINVQPFPPRTLRIEGGEKLTGDKRYSFSITDSSQTSKPVIITINTK